MYERDYKYLILGGGVVAGYAAQEFVGQGLRSGELGIISADQMLPYDRPPLSKDFLAGQKTADDILINDLEFYKKHGINVWLNSPAETVDLERKVVYAADNNRVTYEKLLIATGSRVRTLDLPSAALEGILYLRWSHDARRIREYAEESKQVGIVGAGYIGMEVASVLAHRGLEVTIIFPGDRIMKKFFTPEMSAFFQKYYEERGVKLMPGSKVEAFIGDNQVKAIKLESGQQLPVDFVVVGIGVEPAIELLAGTELNISNGILTNEYLETNIPDVYAAGDVANYYDVVFNKQRRIEHWNNAVQQGRHAAQVMSGVRKPYRELPYFFSDVFDLSWEFWGDTQGADQVSYRGDIAQGSFSVWWTKEGRLVGAFVMDCPDEERELAQKLIKEQRQISSDLLIKKEQ
jgi:NADPH-dependent 2,4-dienoyl-CoA reductase/sulfur reductase-like enzyme